MQIQISVTSDFICPWCYIGEKRLERAIKDLPPDMAVEVKWLPFELNGEMPSEGMDRKTYRSRKFGSWEKSQALDAQTVRAGEPDGAAFDYVAIKRTPNTFQAHRLSWWAQAQGKQNAFAQAVLEGYFAKGMDIGAIDVLVDIAGSVGLDRDAAAAFLASNEGIGRVRSLESSAYANGVRGVPHIQIGETALLGAQSASVIRQALLKATTSESAA